MQDRILEIAPPAGPAGAAPCGEPANMALAGDGAADLQPPILTAGREQSTKGLNMGKAGETGLSECAASQCLA